MSSRHLPNQGTWDSSRKRFQGTPRIGNIPRVLYAAQEEKEKETHSGFNEDVKCLVFF